MNKSKSINNSKKRFLRYTGYIICLKTYKARLVANSTCSSCTTTELSKLLSSCITAFKNMLLSTAKKYMKNPVRIYLCLLKIPVKY